MMRKTSFVAFLASFLLTVGEGNSFVNIPLTLNQKAKKISRGVASTHHHGFYSFKKSDNDGARGLFATIPGKASQQGRKSSENTAADDEKRGLNALSVSELKRLLMDRGVDFRDCLEKSDLVDRLLKSSPSSSASAASRPQESRSSTYTDHERGLIETFKRVSPSVVYIQTTTKVVQQRGLKMHGMEVPAGTGSGFLWDNQGHVVTNYHVVTGGQRGRGKGGLPNRVMVKLTGMTQALEAKVVGVEPEKDLAVLKLVSMPGSLPSPIDVGTSGDLEVGQSVLAIGNPYGLDDTLTTGVVSALGRDVDGIGGRPIRGCVQTDAAINPGNSGGPLLDSSGRLIGVNTAIFSPGNGMAGNVGIGFAIPVDTVRRVVNQIIRFGHTVRPTLGITIVNDNVVRSIEAQLGRTLPGVLVADVFPNSPAVVAGLHATRRRTDGSIELGDLITHINGEPVSQTEDLMSAIEEKKDGERLTLRVWRKTDPNKAESVQVRLTTRDKLSAEASALQTERRRGNGLNDVFSSKGIWE